MKVTPSQVSNKVVYRTTSRLNPKKAYQWWRADSDKETAEQLVTTAAYLKVNQNYRQRQNSMYARLYGNMSVFNFIGNNPASMDQNNKGLPTDRPTYNLIQSSVDTLVAKIGQNKPVPVFLTDNGDYKERRLAKQLNNFVLGEFYQTKAYEKAVALLRDALVTGTGCLKIYETQDNKVGLERVLQTEIFTDSNDALYGEPRQLYQIKLIDRQVLIEQAPKYKNIISKAEAAFPDNSGQNSQTIADQVLVVEGWHLKSGKDAKDGRHTIACSTGIILNEEYDKEKFPFLFLHYSPRMLGFWAQGLAEQLMGTQLEINSLLYTITRAIKLVGVPRVFVEEGSKVTNTSHNNDIGVIVKYRGVKPSYEVAPAVAQEMYAQLDRLIERGYQQCGVSFLQASSQKPAGLNSGEAIRSYDDISSDRFATLSKRYDDFFVDLAYWVTDMAKDIATRDGKYQTIYPNKDGTKEIDLPKMSLLQDPFVIQCFNTSSLPRDPAGRLQKITEMLSSGMLTLKEARRLLDYPDLNQVERLANASAERIYQILDEIVEEGKYTPPDSFMDLAFAKETAVAYYNLYSRAQLEEERCQLIRDFYSQVLAMETQALAAAAPPSSSPMGGGEAPGSSPVSQVPDQAVLAPPPTSGVNSAA